MQGVCSGGIKPNATLDTLVLKGFLAYSQTNITDVSRTFKPVFSLDLD